MLVYDISNKLAFGMYLEVAQKEIAISTYTFKEGAGSAMELESSANHEFMAGIDIIHTQSIDLEELKSLPEWEDYTLWNVIVKNFMGIELSKPINRNSFTMGSKINRTGFINMFSSIVLELVVPHKNVTSFADIGIAVITGKGFPFVCNIPCLEKDHSLPEEYGMGQGLRRKMLPSLRLTGPETIGRNETAEYSVEVVVDNKPLQQAVTIFLESSSGYLPVRRLDNVTHTTAFKLRADALDPGHRIHLKAGFKYWSSLAEKEITVQ